MTANTNSNKGDTQDKLRQNLLLLKRLSYNVKFNLEGTNYEAIENIGSGAYGVVCSALHKKTKDKVAIKKIPSIFDHEEIAKRTYREVKILKHFKHDNIISIREILRQQGADFKDIYIVLDFMESDLNQIIYSPQLLTEEHVRFFLYQILRGLKYIHSANVIHRDLKPSNLLVNGNCELKIGDFGMARGFVTTPEEHKFLMTTYVATRWYRAPEIMLPHVEYTAAVDIWSVGCIFGEMVGRKHLFPGRDTMHQIQLIMNVRGRPDSEYLRSMKLDEGENMLKDWPVQDPIPLKRLYPKMKDEDLELLDALLQFNPHRRISVQQALKHPFLNKYHDPDDEPMCIPVFDFDFEKKKRTSQELRAAITKEILDNSHPSSTLNLAKVDLKPVPSGTLKPASKNNLKPVPSRALPVGSLVPIGPTSRAPVTGLHLSQAHQPSATGLQAFLMKQKLKQGGVKAPPQPAPRQHDQVVPQMNAASQHGGVLDFIKKEPQLENKPDLKPAMTVDTKVTSDDIEMLSARSVKDEKTLSIATDRTLLGTPHDVDMPSAKKEAQLAEEETKKLDPKALLKEAILKAGLRRQQQGDNITKKKPITAHQRQREREERRKKKIVRAKDKKKRLSKEKAPSPITVLTDDDRNMLERWKTMQNKAKAVGVITNEQPVISSAQNNLQKVTVSDRVTSVDLVLGTDHSDNSSQSLPSQYSTSTSSLDDSRPASVVSRSTAVSSPDMESSESSQSSIDYQAFESASQMMLDNFTAGCLHGNPGDQAGRNVNNHNISISTQLNLTPLASLQAQFMVSPPNLVDASSSALAQIASDQAKGTTTRLFSPESEKSSDAKPVNISDIPLGFTGVLSRMPNHISPTDLPGQSSSDQSSHTLLPSYTEAVQAKIAVLLQNPNLPEISINQHSLPGAGKPSEASDIMSYSPQPGPSNAGRLQTTAARGLKVLTMTSNNPVSTDPRSTDNSLESPGIPCSWQDIGQLSKQMFKSHVDDLTLAQTPKGKGGGYGVGFDLRAIVQETLMETKADSPRCDSAPLSASLIADWLELRGAVDGDDLEALQKEIEMNSPLLFADLSS